MNGRTRELCRQMNIQTDREIKIMKINRQTGKKTIKQADKRTNREVVCTQA